MRLKIPFGRSILPVLLLCFSFGHPRVWALDDRRTSREIAPDQSSRKIISAPPNMGTEEKLDRILANQEEIFKRLDMILEELKIVKIRATID